MNSKYALKLYYFAECPYCQIVLDRIHELNLEVELKNTRKDSVAKQELESDTGRSTVPCLYINGTPMHESRDIINWLQENQENLKRLDHGN